MNVFQIHNNLLQKNILFRYIPIRYRFKPKRLDRKKKSPTQLALEHFDHYYKPVYQHLWPSIRLALLSQQKHCALINNYANKEDIIVDMLQNGTDDIVGLARKVELPDYSDQEKDKISLMQVKDDQHLFEADLEMEDENEWILPGGQDLSMYSFMPAKKVVSEAEQRRQEEMQQNIYRASENEVMIANEEPVLLPPHLHAFAFEKGDISLFPKPKQDSSGKISYYMMDAGSLLPVIALGIQPGDHVLDVCAAPGGKTLTMLQTMLPESVTCIDHSYGRIGRLHNIINWYLPAFYKEDKKVVIIHGDANRVCADPKHARRYDRVLVDVPCFTDRHVVTEDENNLFHSSRMEDRLAMQNLQASLLFQGISCCKPGGSIVYSTCTLSPPQNDGIINQVTERLWMDTKIDVVVQNTKYITDKFKDSMYFYDNCRFGQLVLPNVVSNFGPTYFCKLKRIN